MKVLMLITGLGVGGAERQVCDLADSMAKVGVSVRLVCLAGTIEMSPSQPGVEVANLGMMKSAAGLLRAARSFRAMIREFRPDVIHCHLVHANLFGRLMRIGLDVPVVISSAHNTDEGGWWRMWGYRLTDSLADLSTNVSADAVQAFKRRGALGRRGMRVIYNGISTGRFQFDESTRNRVRVELGISPVERLILNVGSLSLPKNQASLIQAFAFIQHSSANFRLAIAGKGPLESSLRDLAHRLNLGAADVRFLGVRNDVEALMCAADIFVLSSTREGFGLVVAEAMACERVVIATDCGGVKEVLGDEGFLVTPGSDRELSEAMARALSLSEDGYRELGRRARERVAERFSIDAAVDAWLGVYEELIRSKGGVGIRH